MIKWSVSQIVFLLIAVALVIAFLFEIYMGKISLDSKDFIGIAMLVFGFYFSKPSATQEEIATGTAK